MLKAGMKKVKRDRRYEFVPMDAIIASGCLGIATFLGAHFHSHVIKLGIDLPTHFCVIGGIIGFTLGIAYLVVRRQLIKKALKERRRAKRKIRSEISMTTVDR